MTEKSVLAELVLSMQSDRRIMELKKRDNDTWILVLSETRPDGRELPREALIVTSEELRCICENKYLFGKSS